MLTAYPKAATLCRATASLRSPPPPQAVPGGRPVDAGVSARCPWCQGASPRPQAMGGERSNVPHASSNARAQRPQPPALALIQQCWVGRISDHPAVVPATAGLLRRSNDRGTPDRYPYR